MKHLEKNIFELTETSRKSIGMMEKSVFLFGEVMTFEQMDSYKKDVEFKIDFIDSRVIKMTRPSEKNTNPNIAYFEVEMDANTYWTEHLHPDCIEVITLTKGSLFDYRRCTFNFFEEGVDLKDQKFNVIRIPKNTWHFFKTDEETEFNVQIIKDKQNEHKK